MTLSIFGIIKTSSYSYLRGNVKKKSSYLKTLSKQVGGWSRLLALLPPNFSLTKPTCCVLLYIEIIEQTLIKTYNQLLQGFPTLAS